MEFFSFCKRKEKSEKCVTEFCSSFFGLSDFSSAMQLEWIARMDGTFTVVITNDLRAILFTEKRWQRWIYPSKPKWQLHWSHGNELFFEHDSHHRVSGIFICFGIGNRALIASINSAQIMCVMFASFEIITSAPAVPVELCKQTDKTIFVFIHLDWISTTSNN